MISNFGFFCIGGVFVLCVLICIRVITERTECPYRDKCHYQYKKWITHEPQEPTGNVPVEYDEREEKENENETSRIE